MALRRNIWWKSVACILILTISDVTEDRKASNTWYIALSVCCLSLLIFIMAVRQKKKKSTTEDEFLLRESPTTGPTCVSGERRGDADLSLDSDSYQRFNCEICQTKDSCCTIGEGSLDKDHCLKRELIALHTADLCTDISDDFQEAVLDTITSREMLTVQNRRLRSDRMLILGDAGMGKTCLCEEVELDWKIGKRDIVYKYVFFFTFRELSSLSMPLNVRELIELKCEKSTTILSDLLSSDTLLIFDGLDMLMHDIQDFKDFPENGETPMNITTLLSGILTKKFLPEIDVLVTSGFNFWKQWKEHFTLIFVMLEYAEKNIQKHVEFFSKLNGLLPNCYRFIQLHNLSSLVSVPLLNLVFCEICREQDLECYEGRLDTHSRLFASLLQCTLRNISPEVAVAVEECQPIMQAADRKLNPNIKTACEHLAKLSYKKLNTNCLEIKKEELPTDSDLLLRHLCKFFLIEQSGSSVYKYRHHSVRDMFAAFYCAGKIQNNDELEECLDAWAFGEIPTHPTNVLLQGITRTKQECLHNFIQLFLGFLAYEKIDDILFNPRPLKDDRRQFLIKWLQKWVDRKDNDLLNIFHCVFELHDTDVTRAVSRCFKSVSLYSTQLYPLDLTALQYSLSEANLEKLDLRVCGQRDGSLELLPMIGRCKSVWLTSNKLTEKSTDELGKILKSETCTIKNLLLGGNKLGPAGAQNLWKVLEKNKSLRVLFLNDNEITAEGTKGMAKSLKSNTSLKELLLCGNPLGEGAVQNITQLRRSQLKIIFRVADNEDQQRYMMAKVDGLAKPELETGDQEILLYMLKSVLKDIKQEEKTASERVLQLKKAMKLARDSILQEKKTE